MYGLAGMVGCQVRTFSPLSSYSGVAGCSHDVVDRRVVLHSQKQGLQARRASDDASCRRAADSQDLLRPGLCTGEQADTRDFGVASDDVGVLPDWNVGLSQR